MVFAFEDQNLIVGDAGRVGARNAAFPAWVWASRR
jgi:hypothetical protein